MSPFELTEAYVGIVEKNRVLHADLEKKIGEYNGEHVKTNIALAERDEARKELANLKVELGGVRIGLSTACHELKKASRGRDLAEKGRHEARKELIRIKEHVATFMDTQSNQQAHKQLCARVVFAAIDAGMIGGFGACGGGAPTFAAIVAKIEEATLSFRILRKEHEVAIKSTQYWLREALERNDPEDHIAELRKVMSERNEALKERDSLREELAKVTNERAAARQGEQYWIREARPRNEMADDISQIHRARSERDAALSELARMRAGK